MPVIKSTTSFQALGLLSLRLNFASIVSITKHLGEQRTMKSQTKLHLLSDLAMSGNLLNISLAQVAYIYVKIVMRLLYNSPAHCFELWIMIQVKFNTLLQKFDLKLQNFINGSSKQSQHLLLNFWLFYAHGKFRFLRNLCFFSKKFTLLFFFSRQNPTKR